MNVIKYATVFAVAVASVTACGAGVATGEPTTPCMSATPDVLTSVVLRDHGENVPQPITIDEVRCSGDWAFSSITVRYIPETNPPSMVLYHYDGGDWRTEGLGSGFDCINQGVPPSVAEELEC